MELSPDLHASLQVCGDASSLADDAFYALSGLVFDVLLEKKTEDDVLGEKSTRTNRTRRISLSKTINDSAESKRDC